MRWPRTAHNFRAARIQHGLRVEAHHVIIVMFFFIARHHIPQNTFPGKAHRSTVKLIQQQDMLGRTAVFTAQATAFIMAEAVFVRKKLTSTPRDAAQLLLEQATFTLQQLTLFAIQPGLVANPDIKVGRAALSDGKVLPIE